VAYFLKLCHLLVFHLLCIKEAIFFTSFLYISIRNSVGRMADAITECWMMLCVSYCIVIWSFPFVSMSQPLSKMLTL